MLGDGAKFPKPEFQFPDGRLKTTEVSRTEVIFKYVIQYMKYDMINGYWNHQDNELHFADYKIHNSFCLFTTDADGEQIDSAFDEYLYWQGCAGEQALFAFELMTRPSQVAERAKSGWRVVGTTGQARPPWVYCHTKEKREGVWGLRQRWKEGNHWHPQYQYVTQGPKFLAWQTDNNVVVPWGEWWRPDIWEYRVRLHVASDVGLKSVVIHDGDRGVFRRFDLDGKKDFEHSMVLTNCQQRDLVPVVEDVQGRRAIGMSVFNRNTMMDQFICGDRCNFLGRCSLRTRDRRHAYTPPGFRGNLGISPSKGQMDLQVMPDIATTLDTPTLPIDGKPIGAPEFVVTFQPNVPGELKRPFSLPTIHMIGPEMGIGQGTYRLGYDPTENGAKTTRRGHPYVSPEKQGHIGRNAWTSWYRLVPLKKLSGWARVHVCAWLPEELRTGWLDVYWKLIDDVTLGEKGVQFGYFQGACEVYQRGKLVASPEKGISRGKFDRGTIALTPTGMLIALDDGLTYDFNPKLFRLSYLPENAALKKDDELRMRVAFAGGAHGTPKRKLAAFASQFGITEPGTVAYRPRLLKGKEIDNYFTWRLDGAATGIAAVIPKTVMHGHLTTTVENLNDNWTVQLLDRARSWPNHRELPIREGRAYAQLDLNEADLDLFIGHPVTASDTKVKLLVTWKSPGRWSIEAHNPGDQESEVKLKSDPEWTVFSFGQTVKLAPGSSKVWEVEGR